VQTLDTFDLSAFRYATSGHLLYVTDHRLVARPFDASALRFTGEAAPIAEGFGIGGPGQPPFSVSETGVLVFRPVGVFDQMQPTWISRTGVQLGVVGTPAPYRVFDLSPDGQTLAAETQTEQQRAIWTIDIARGTSSRFTSETYSQDPRWFPTGDKIAYGSVRDTPPNPFVRTLAGVETRLLHPQENWPLMEIGPVGRLVPILEGNTLFLGFAEGCGGRGRRSRCAQTSLSGR